ncbi:MAG: glycine cleavage system protein GcvH [Candidatus Omnitrophica bacterium]|nr:glycine cleavage system protein GcvH [Candidatus Omnitrophota bacterium]MBU0878291.1 glycine cleavage system protein GcvH [Candidatus Omnitrophota bacterium]MBU1133477.1 glycine cleavage system protein GcvH [Candidatus Omnitrophota bacterium]MBU1367339.1 glycine cleavage system protein GcvH [Candidatus Omnitrophota bacterium]MBU1523967.1 glycine cleavage system protein GcvH [Candidatus Omnitrophota bacterium]
MSNLKFNKSHEWVKVEGDCAVIGISDYAQGELGDIVFVELPEVGVKISEGSSFGTVESTKAASEIFAPLSGEVIQANNDLVNNPQWVNEDPQGKGWMIKIKVENSKEMDNFMDEVAYKEFVDKESQ